MDVTVAPFHLDDTAVEWVERTFATLTVEQKVGQLLVPTARLDDRAALDAALDASVGGLIRGTNHPPELLRDTARYLQENARIPLLLPGDLEYDECRAVGGLAGTQMPNQLTIAATANPAWAGKVAAVAAAEGRWCGYNWSFTPVVDVDYNHDNPVVNTRSFGSDPDRVTAFSVAYLRALQAGGLAACAKHWPGDGIDDRDQHATTSVNTLDLDAWRASYGAVYRALIDAGVRTIMSAHISLPAYAASRGAAPREAYLPATLSAALNLDLLRGELGFAGLIVSDASEMAGFTSQGHRDDIVPLCIERGCDVLLLNDPGDAGRLLGGLKRGLLSYARLDEAVRRVLALKASLGLHVDPGPWEGGYRTAEHLRLAEECAESAVTLIRDEQQLLPLSPTRHRRILVITEPHRANVLGPLPPLRLPDMLAGAGFEVSRYQYDTAVDPDRYDVLLYLVAHEAKQGKVQLRLRWDDLHGGIPRLMERHWHHIPTVFVSLGNPYHLYEVPRCLTFINAYSPVEPVQRALVQALTGKIAFAGTSPVNPYAGLAEGEYIDS